MMHDIVVEGDAFRLRPVKLEDAQFIVDLRNDPRLSRFINRGAGDVVQQRAWLEGYFQRGGDYYFVVERRKDRTAEGLISIYDLENSVAEWGRWVLKPNSLAAPESAYLIYRAAFDQLQVSELYCRTLSENKAVVSFHDRCGLVRRREIPDYALIEGTAYAATEHVSYLKDWPEQFTSLREQSRKIAELIDRR